MADKNSHKPKTDKDKLGRSDYEARLEQLQIELNQLARWLQHTGKRLLVLIEGRDTAGKGGVISAIADALPPRVCKTVALPKPNERESTQWYFQRYVPHLPAAGELVLFDRSWYNRAGVETVMGYCSEQQTPRASCARRRCSRSCWSTTACCCSSTGSRSTRRCRRSVSPSGWTTR